jgi:drug/metabolite transporter (DMT)-like permease
MRGSAIALGLGAAALFGASIPAVKIVAARTGPLALAALLYLGAGIALSAARVAAAATIGNGPERARRAAREPPLRARDAPALAGIVIFGAVAGPVFLVLGLRRLPGAAGALLLNLEAPLTALFAVLLFGEHLGRRGLVAVALIGGGACALAAAPGSLQVVWAGAGFIALACAAWALDTNLTQRLSLRDPVALVRFKALCGGSCTLLCAAAAREGIPGLAQIVAALAVGALGYGLSIVWHVRALRELGAARQSAIFATAPFAGALLSWPLLGEAPGLRELGAATLMGIGIALLVSERHAHMHEHESVEHDHLHVHDEHHRHGHEGPVTEPHSHLHRHDALVHEHPHAPDLHHRHRHRE